MTMVFTFSAPIALMDLSTTVFRSGVCAAAGSASASIIRAFRNIVRPPGRTTFYIRPLLFAEREIKQIALALHLQHQRIGHLQSVDRHAQRAERRYRCGVDAVDD